MVDQRVTTRPRQGGTSCRGARRGAVLALIALAATGLDGCSSIPDAVNPVTWYQDIVGSPKKAETGNERNTQNLESGNKEPFPNLADVPPPPDKALSGIEREALQKSLVADRENAKYTDEELRAGHANAPGAAPPKPATPTVAADTSSATPASPPSAAPPSTSAPAPASSGEPRAPGPRRNAGAPAREAPPQESSLTSPSVRSEPEGETPRPAPPPPTLTPRPNAPASPSPSAAAPASAPPEQVAAAPAAAPPPPEVEKIEPPPAPDGPGSAVSVQIADIQFADGSSKIPPADHKQLAEAAKLHKQYGGIIRVVGYAQRGRGQDAAQQELQSFGLALDRAKAVALALSQMGVPAKDVAVEAAPLLSGGGIDQPRAEVFLEY